MKLPIFIYPDEKLKLISKPVEFEGFNIELHTLLDNMFETMIDSQGIGLAAIQVGQEIRALILCIPNEDDIQSKESLLEIINPKISNEEGSITYREGCLSVPEFFEDIQRYETLTLNYQDRHGTPMEIHVEGLLSVAIQHEIDHLNGNLFIEKLSYSSRKKFEKEYKKLLKSKK